MKYQHLVYLLRRKWTGLSCHPLPLTTFWIVLAIAIKLLSFFVIHYETNLDSNTRCTKNNTTLPDSGTSSDTNQGFTSTTWKHNHTRSCTTISKHFFQGLFLIRSVYVFLSCSNWILDHEISDKNWLKTILSVVVGLRSIGKSGIFLSFLKSYSARSGYSKAMHLFCTSSI